MSAAHMSFDGFGRKSNQLAAWGLVETKSGLRARK